ncbi:NAD(P)H-dependent oxidoreductase [Roseibium sp. HPY-6]|uniref:NAD(P)H-dependent oxidoreductase n=1 Tax=Roseibium sp. HPY-6 TaxID=3229852 RepID=UPI00338E7962
MHIHIVHAHPEKSSYNAALTEAAFEHLANAGHSVSKSDLYLEQFDPVERGANYKNRADRDVFAALNEQRHASGNDTFPIDVQREIESLRSADFLVLQFPLWWHGPPAILKGWMDRVFVNGGLYSSRMRYDTGYFSGKRALVSVTTGAPQKAFGPGCRGGDFEVMLWPVHYSLHYVGYEVLPPFVSYGVQGHGYSYEREETLRERLKQNLSNWRGYLSKIDEIQPLKFPGWSDWDEDGRALT